MINGHSKGHQKDVNKINITGKGLIITEPSDTLDPCIADKWNKKPNILI